MGGYQGCETSVALPRILISCLTFLRLQPKMQSEASLRWKTPDWKNNNNQRTSNASHRIASRRPKAEAVSFVRQQVALWSQQEKKKNRKREEELGDWLTFPVRAAAVCPVAVAPMASGACDEHGEPPGGRPHSHPMGTGHRAERRCPVGSPESLTKIVQTFHVTQKQKWKDNQKKVNLSSPVRHVRFWLACVRSRGWTGEPSSWKEAPSCKK